MKNYIVVPIILLAILIQWYSHSSGLLITDDSNHYLAGSESFRNTQTLVDYDGHAYLFWPPLFAIILSFFGPSVEWLTWINIIQEICIAFVVLRIANRVIHHTAVRILYFLFVMLGVHILLISSFLWSELIFMFFAVIFVDQLLQSKESRASFYLAIISGFLMCLQRNAGLFIAVGAALWVFINEENLKVKLGRSIVLFLGVTSGLLIWNVYVWFFLPHEHFDFSTELFQHAWTNANSIAHGLINTFLPIPNFNVPIVIIAFTILLYFLKTDIKENPTLQLLFIITVSYLVFLTLVVVINIGGFPLDYGEGDRFISVVIPFLGILFFKSFENIFEHQEARVRILILILMSCWMSYPIGRTIKNAIQWHNVSIDRVD